MLPFCVNVSVDKCLVLGGSRNGKIVKPIEIYDESLNSFYVPSSKVILPGDIKKIFGVFYVGKEIYEEVDYKPMDTEMFYELNANIYNVRSSFNSTHANTNVYDMDDKNSTTLIEKVAVFYLSNADTLKLLHLFVEPQGTQLNVKLAANKT